MDITFKVADDSDLIGSLVVGLTTEICELTNTTHYKKQLVSFRLSLHYNSHF